MNNQNPIESLVVSLGDMAGELLIWRAIVQIKYKQSQADEGPKHPLHNDG